MPRFLATLLFGVILGLAGEKALPQALPHTPAAVQSAAASIGLQTKPSAPALQYSTTPALPLRAAPGPLSASIQAEINKKYDDALKGVVSFQQSGGDPFVAYLRLGWLYYLKGSYPDAEQAYGYASRLHPTALNPVLGLLNVAEAMKDSVRIQRAAEAVLRVDPANYRASMILGSRTYTAHDYRGSAFIYRRVLNTYPDDIDARSGLAWADYYTGDTHDAAAQFQIIMNIQPEYPFARQGYKLVAGVTGASPPPR